MIENFTLADVLGCLGADLIDVAQCIEQLPPELQVAAAGVELSTSTTATDALSVEVSREVTVVALALVD